ncbi:MAG: hypothetical protein K8R92_01865 [Planctomycetes bacterium]|nr:hypothetical protein [Planctomycetota bacterium]
MNVTKNVITDLYPLYAEMECSADTQALVEEYLRLNPGHAEELKRILNASIPGTAPQATDLGEAQSLRKAKRCVRLSSWVEALAIFFTMVPFSFLHTGDKTYWLIIESPNTALVYFALAIVCWGAFVQMRWRTKCL